MSVVKLNQANYIPVKLIVLLLNALLKMKEEFSSCYIACTVHVVQSSKFNVT